MLTREIKFAGRANQKTKSVPIVISTDTPYERGQYVEVLDHGPGGVDLSRAPLPLIESHDASKVNIGIVEKLHLDGGKLRGMAVFGSTQRAEELFKDVTDGIVSGVSVGYHHLDEGTLISDRTYRFKWKPFEASVVSVPADTNAGFNRQHEVKIMSNAQQGGPAATTEADRVKDIVAIGRTYAKYLRESDVSEAVAGNTSVEQFKNLILQRMETGHMGISLRAIGASNAEANRYSFGRALRAMLTNDWTDAGYEREVSRTLERTFGRAPEGIFVPSDAFRRDFNVGTSTEAGNLVSTDLRGDLYVDALRNAMVLGRLGVRVLPNLVGNIDIPRKATASTLGMVTEIGSASETNPVTGKISLSPKRVSAYIEVSKQAIIQSAIGLESMLRDDLLMGAASQIENQSLNGSGTSPNVLGLRNYTTIGSTTAGTNGAAVAWSHFLDLEGACADANAEPGMLAGYVTNSKVRKKAKQTARGTNLDFIIPPDARQVDGGVMLNGYRTYFSNTIPSNLTKGTSTTVCSAAIFSSDWGMAVLGFFGAPDVVVDPYSLATTGQVRITLNQFFDFGIRQPSAFAKIEDLLTT